MPRVWRAFNVLHVLVALPAGVIVGGIAGWIIGSVAPGNCTLCFQDVAYASYGAAIGGGLVLLLVFVAMVWNFAQRTSKRPRDDL